jgi:hypothetical protein
MLPVLTNSRRFAILIAVPARFETCLSQALSSPIAVTPGVHGTELLAGAYRASCPDGN